MTRAVLLAAGMGTRMLSLVKETPKPLIPVCGIPMMKTLVDGLAHAGAGKIYIASGYLIDQMERFVSEYNSSTDKTHIEIIHNPYYEHVNNISSAYVSREIIRQGDCFVCEADLYVRDFKIFDELPNYSCYYGKFKPGYVDDWGFVIDGNDVNTSFIKRVCKGVTDCYNMTGIAYLKAHEASQLADALERTWDTPGYENLFWDDVVDRNLDNIKLKVHPIEPDSIEELDTEEELRRFEKILEENKN